MESGSRKYCWLSGSGNIAGVAIGNTAGGERQ